MRLSEVKNKNEKERYYNRYGSDRLWAYLQCH
jgi:hypothetical protein